MTSLVLSRMSFMPGSGFVSDAEQREVAARLAYELQYEGHIRKVNYQQIAAKLNQIGCTPFSASSIKRYKRWMTMKVSGLLRALTFTGTTIALLVGLIHACMYFNVGPIFVVPSVVATIASGITMVVSWLSFADVEAYWDTTYIGGFTGILPDDAARKMLKIHDAFPLASFSVEELKVKRIVRDPFLVAIIDGYKFHVSVWNEPEYVPHI